MNEQVVEYRLPDKNEQMLIYLRNILFYEDGKAKLEIPEPLKEIWGIEGSDGSGKSVMEKPLQLYLQAQDYEVQIVERKLPNNFPTDTTERDRLFREILGTNIAEVLGVIASDARTTTPLCIMQNSIVRQLAYIISKAEDYDIRVINPYVQMLKELGPVIGNILYVKVDPEIAFERILQREGPSPGDPQNVEEAKTRAYVYDQVITIMENLGVRIYTVNNNEDLSSFPDISQALQDKLKEVI